MMTCNHDIMMTCNHEYMVPAQADTDPRVMEAFVQRKYPQLPGPPHVPPVQLFSRKLLAYLETLVGRGGIQSLLQGR